MPTWRMQTCWPAGHPWQATAQFFANEVAEHSGGDFTIQVFPDGGIVPAFQSFQAARDGVVEITHDWPFYWRIYDEAFTIFGAIPFGLDAYGYTSWFYAGDGLTLMQDLYAKYDVVPFPAGNEGQALAMLLKAPANSLGELQGRIIRTAGIMLDIMPYIGINAITMPAGQIYNALATGVVEGAEFAGPAVTQSMGLHEHAKYAYSPGFQKPGIQLACTVNKAAYDALSQEYKDVLREVSFHVQFQEMINGELGNAQAIQSLRNLGVVFDTITPSDLAFIRKIVRSHMNKVRGQSEDLKNIFDKYESHIALVSEWKKLRMGVSAWPYRMYMRGLHTE